MIVNAAGTTIEINVAIPKTPQNCDLIEIIAGKPPTPTEPNTPEPPTIAPVTIVVKMAAKNGYFNGKLTPNIAGSVTPKKPEIPDVIAKPCSLFI